MTDEPPRDRRDADTDELMEGTSGEATPPHPSPAEGGGEASSRPPRPSQAEGEREMDEG